MPVVTCDSLEKDYVKLKKRCQALYDRMGTEVKTISKTNKTLENTMEGLRERIQELKNNGAIGTKIRDFVADRDVRMLYAIAQGYSQSADSNRSRSEGKKEVAEILDEYKGLKDRVAAELKKAEAAKKKDEAAEYGKLLKTVVSLENDKTGTKRLAAFNPEGSKGSADDLDARLKKMIGEIKADPSKGKSVSAKGYDIKAIKKMDKEYRDLAAQTWRQLEDAEAAKKDKDEEELKEAQRELKDTLKTLNEFVKHCETGLNDAKTKAAIAAAPDTDAVNHLLKLMLKPLRERVKNVEVALRY